MHQSQIIELWTALNSDLKTFVISKVKHEDTANDILQNVFLKIYTKIDQLKEADKFTHWLYSITRNEINSYFKSNQRREILFTEETNENPEHQHMVNCVRKFIDQLPENYKTAVRMTELENVPQKELAERLNISYSGAKSRVQRGREKLKELIKSCCDIEHDVYGQILNYTSKSDKRSKC